MIEYIEVITADGEHVIASAHENSELLWAFCGAGPGFFGVVVRIGLKPKPLYKSLSRYLLSRYGRHLPPFVFLHNFMND